LKEIFNTYIKNNLGLINLFGKISGKFLFLLLTSFFAYKLSIRAFASFAIFWTAIRLFTFFSANNLYIIYFNQVRLSLLEEKKWPLEVSVNIIITFIVFGTISTITSYFLFKNAIITLMVFPILFLFLIIRNISEFSKSDNSVYLSIFIEDFLFYLLFFISGVVSIYILNSLIGIVIALLFSTFLTAIISIVLFKRKFNLSIKSFKFKFKYFSKKTFRLGVNYTFLRGNEFLSSFGVRYLGQIYFGDLFVSYAHIMYQFYNIFALITMSVISGLQSKITVTSSHKFNKFFIEASYSKILKTIFPFILTSILIVFFFNVQILNLVFPKYVQFSVLLVKVSMVSLLLVIIQPLVFILIYNNKMTNLRMLNSIQYFIISLVYLYPLYFPKVNEEYWLLLVMTISIVVQGLFSFKNYKQV
jgi:hypothetical protein|tara:strand:- start:2332 stop:3579 length:1248 start_codon:yes stop_codon:yes gene_type:complete